MSRLEENRARLQKLADPRTINLDDKVAEQIAAARALCGGGPDRQGRGAAGQQLAAPGDGLAVAVGPHADHPDDQVAAFQQLGQTAVKKVASGNAGGMEFL